MTNVRKAIEFRLYDFENLSDHTFGYIRNYQIEEKKRGSIVLYGRRMAYDPRIIKSKWAAEFVPALDAAGFIRHDIAPDADWKTFAVVSFYDSIMDLPDRLHLARGWFDLFFSNEAYENFQHLADEQFDEVCQAIAQRTTPEEWEIVKFCGGFTGEAPNWSEASRRFKLDSYKIKRKFSRAMERLKRDSKISELFYQIFDSLEASKAKLDELTSQLTELHKNPIFAEEARLRAAIEETSAKIQQASPPKHLES